MARHSSFKILIAHETYQRFFATIRAREMAEQWKAQQGAGLGAEGQAMNVDLSGSPSPPAQAPNKIAVADLPFFSVDGLPIGQSKSESWIESWLSGKANGAPR